MQTNYLQNEIKCDFTRNPNCPRCMQALPLISQIPLDALGPWRISSLPTTLGVLIVLGRLQQFTGHREALPGSTRYTLCSMITIIIVTSNG